MESVNFEAARRCGTRARSPSSLRAHTGRRPHTTFADFHSSRLCGFSCWCVRALTRGLCVFIISFLSQWSTIWCDIIYGLEPAHVGVRGAGRLVVYWQESAPLFLHSTLCSALAIIIVWFVHIFGPGQFKTFWSPGLRGERVRGAWWGFDGAPRGAENGQGDRGVPGPRPREIRTRERARRVGGHLSSSSGEPTRAA